VCPWNRFAKPHQEEKFMYPVELENFTNQEWKELTEETFEVLFKKSPLKRSKYQGLKRNIEFLNFAKK
jgi:epoxyqueuosine reductase